MLPSFLSSLKTFPHLREWRCSHKKFQEYWQVGLGKKKNQNQNTNSKFKWCGNADNTWSDFSGNGCSPHPRLTTGVAKPSSPSGTCTPLLTWIQTTNGKQFQDFHLFCVTIISASSFRFKLLRKIRTLLEQGWGLGSRACPRPPQMAMQLP